MLGTSVREPDQKIVQFVLLCGILMDRQEVPEKAFILDTIRYSNFYFFNSTYLIFIQQGVNLDGFTPEPDCAFLEIFKYNLHRKWNPERPGVAKVILVQTSKFQLVLLENYSCEYLYQVLNCRFHSTTELSL